MSGKRLAVLDDDVKGLTSNLLGRPFTVDGCASHRQCALPPFIACRPALVILTRPTCLVPPPALTVPPTTAATAAKEAGQQFGRKIVHAHQRHLRETARGIWEECECPPLLYAEVNF
jgi:hypothetical protein